MLRAVFALLAVSAVVALASAPEPSEGAFRVPSPQA